MNIYPKNDHEDKTNTSQVTLHGSYTLQDGIFDLVTSVELYVGLSESWEHCTHTPQSRSELCPSVLRPLS